MQFQISCGKFHEKSHTKEQSKASVDRSNNKNKPKITQKQRMQPSALTLKKLENYSLLTRHVSSAVLKCLPGCALFIRMLASCFLLTALHTRTYLNLHSHIRPTPLVLITILHTRFCIFSASRYFSLLFPY